MRTRAHTPKFIYSLEHTYICIFTRIRVVVALWYVRLLQRLKKFYFNDEHSYIFFVINVIYARVCI